MKPIQLQQGDVLLRRVESIPDSAKPVPARDSRGIVLAEGEHTGHWHGSDDHALTLLEEPNGRRFLENRGVVAVEITHAEHNPITVEPGIWEIGIVREKDWFADMVRPVWD